MKRRHRLLFLIKASGPEAPTPQSLRTHQILNSSNKKYLNDSTHGRLHTRPTIRNPVFDLWLPLVPKFAVVLSRCAQDARWPLGHKGLLQHDIIEGNTPLAFRVFHLLHAANFLSQKFQLLHENSRECLHAQIGVPFAAYVLLRSAGWLIFSLKPKNTMQHPSLSVIATIHT
jgi:hypothetical protein